MSKFSTEEKVRIVPDGMRYPEGITGLCRQRRKSRGYPRRLNYRGTLRWVVSCEQDFT